MNGNNVGTTNNSYNYIPSNNDNVQCILTRSGAGCYTNNPATSNVITMVVYTTGTPCPGVPTVSYGGQTYNTVQICMQCWLKENLNIGTKITGTVSQTNNSIVEKYCYGNDDANCALYGGLYQWDELMNYTASSSANPSGRQGICPVGWHLPSDAEYCQMETFLDPTVSCSGTGWRGATAGGKLKEAGTLHWTSPNTGATNTSGFTSLPEGGMYAPGNFVNITLSTTYWTTTESSSTDAWMRVLDAYHASAYRWFGYGKAAGFSARCVRN